MMKVLSTKGAIQISERVGIEATSDVGGGFDVGFTSPGEWLGYTVNVPLLALTHCTCASLLNLPVAPSIRRRRSQL